MLFCFVTAPASVLYSVPDPPALNRGFYPRSVSPSGRRSYPAGVLCILRTAPASPPTERRTARRAGQPSEWASRPGCQRLSSPPHAGRSPLHARQEIPSCGGTSYKQHRPRLYSDKELFQINTVSRQNVVQKLQRGQPMPELFLAKITTSLHSFPCASFTLVL